MILPGSIALQESLNEPAEPAAEFSPGGSEAEPGDHSEKNN